MIEFYLYIYEKTPGYMIKSILNLKNQKFIKSKYKKLYFDLSKYVKSVLLKNKIKKIEKIKIDTFDINVIFLYIRCKNNTI